MSTPLNLRLIMAGAIALAAVSAPAFAGASSAGVTATTEFSAQAVDPNKKKGPVQGAPKVNNAPKSNNAPKVNNAPKTFVAPKNNNAPKNFGAPKNNAPKIFVAPKNNNAPKNFGNQNNNNAPKNFGNQNNPKFKKNNLGNQNNAPKFVTPNSGAPKTASKVFTPRGARSNVVSAGRIHSAPARGAFRTSIRGRNYSVWRSGYRARYRGGWRTFVGLGALGVLAIGAYEYYPYAYVDAPSDYCDGRTEDGCQLVYDEVETMEGDVIPQCVAYCRQ